MNIGRGHGYHLPKPMVNGFRLGIPREVRVEPPETIFVEDNVVGCDGGGGPLGHPRVFLNLEADGAIDCPYCGRRFVVKTRAADPH